MDWSNSIWMAALLNSDRELNREELRKIMFGRPSRNSIPATGIAWTQRCYAVQSDSQGVGNLDGRARFPRIANRSCWGWAVSGVRSASSGTSTGVHTTAVGYAAGHTPNPTYQEVCSGMTGHNEVVLVVFRPAEISFDELLKTFWESHNPTQGMRQGNDQRYPVSFRGLLQ